MIALLLCNIILSNLVTHFIRSDEDELKSYAAVFAGVVSSLLVVVLFCKYVDGKRLSSMGTAITKPFHGIIGLLMALLILGAGTLWLIAGKNLHWTGLLFDPFDLFTWIMLMAMVAVAEELAFRGYILNHLLSIMPRWWALTISSIIFAAFHINNPGSGFLPLINILMGGFLLGINYIYTKNLWFGILFHFTWNFYQGPVLGYRVSGIQPGSLFQQKLSGNAILTGGNFGFEGSLIYSVLTAAGILLLVWMHKTQVKPMGIQPREQEV